MSSTGWPIDVSRVAIAAILPAGAERDGEPGTNELIGTEVDLNRNLLDLVTAARLTDDEIREFGRL